MEDIDGVDSASEDLYESQTFEFKLNGSNNSFDNRIEFEYDDDTIPLVDDPTESTAMCTYSNSDTSAGNASIASNALTKPIASWLTRTNLGSTI
jgi:hypothetical protein